MANDTNSSKPIFQISRFFQNSQKFDFSRHHAQKMYDAAQEPKELWVIENLGHADPAISSKVKYKARVVSFFEAAFGE